MRFTIATVGYLASVLVSVAACGGGQDSGSPSEPGGGGGVGFGGAQDIGEFRQILDQGEIPGPDTLDANGLAMTACCLQGCGAEVDSCEMF